ncbi:MAG: hypothetical protein J0H59_18890 [Comamonadaceae bacterium]|nr:hypothetical protein [Comamonadaceae bacterium]
MELALAAWGLVTTRFTGRLSNIPLSPFSGLHISEVCENHRYFDEKFDDQMTLQALQDSAIAVLLGGVPPTSEQCILYTQEFVRIFRPYVRDHLLLGLREILSPESIERIESLPQQAKRELSVLPQSAANVLFREVHGTPAEQISELHRNFMECIDLLASEHGIKADTFREKAVHFAHVRGLTEGKAVKEIKSLAASKSRSNASPEEISEADVSGFMRHILKVLRAYGYASTAEQ